MSKFGRRGFFALIASLLLTFVVSGCGKPTIEGQKKRYTETKDRIEAYATKNPLMKMDIQKKVGEFEAEMKTAEAKTGEEAVSAVGALVSRMEKYEKELKPAAATPAAGTTPAPGSKLGGTAPPAVPVPVPAAPAQPGSKLGGAPPVPPAPAPTVPAPVAPAGGSGFGGK